MSVPEPTPTRRVLHRWSSPGLLLAGVLLLLMGALIAAYPTYRFADDLIMGVTHPVAEFDAGETHEFRDDTPFSRYYLAMEVNSHQDPLPPLQVHLNALGVEAGQGGEEIETEPTNSWASILGREYKRFLIISPPASGEFSISVDAPPGEDFLLYREINDVYAHALKRVTPYWLAALLPTMAALVLLGILIVRLVNATSRVDLRLG